MYNSNYYELYHHGVKGQHWGERRWQNEDGSLTPDGREHYGVKAKRLEKKADRIEKSTESHLQKAEDYGRGRTAYTYEIGKAVAPLGFVGGGLIGAGTAAAAGTEAINALLLTAGTAATGGIAPIAIAGASVLGQQVVNALLMHQHTKNTNKVSKIRSRAETYRSKLNENKEDDQVKHYCLVDGEIICHFGIPGQKWGKRRYQNPDGSLTPEGRVHYGVKGTRSSRKIEEKAKAGGYETQEQGERKIRENFERDGFKADIEHDTRPWVNKGKPYVNAWIEKKVNNKSTGNVSISLHTNDYSKQNADKLIDDAKKIEKILPKINKVATDHINEYYKKEKLDRYWNNDKDPSSITKDLLSSISVHDDGTVEVWYNDGNKFRGDYYGGHAISVEYDLKDLLNNDKPKYIYAPSLNG